jgi:hypothetical protein
MFLTLIIVLPSGMSAWEARTVSWNHRSAPGPAISAFTGCNTTS